MMKFRWYYATRAFGALGFLYGIFLDKSGDRTTIIVASAGLMGLDKVARSDENNK